MDNMKTIETTDNNANTFRGACANSCKRILARLAKAKAAILAEALASQTSYPHLVFPALAEEKVRSVAAWEKHQRLLGSRTRPLPF